jgi:DHA2 family multidrug resistance protein
MLVTGVLFAITQLTREKPLVDLSIFKNRNFTMGSLLIFLFGASIYGAVTLLPLYYQSMMDYSAWWAGLAVAPRGIGAVLAMPIVGMLVSRIDTRILVSLGFAGFGVCSFIWGLLTLQISPWSLLVPIILSGVAAGLVFVPLSVVSLGDLPPESVGNGSGLYNLLRNIGGSIGISVVSTILSRHQQVHHNELVRHIVPGDPDYQYRLNFFTQLFSQYAPSVTAQQQAVGQIARTVNQQAMLWSYIDDLRYMALVCLCCVPVVWGLKKVRARGAPAGAH